MFQILHQSRIIEVDAHLFFPPGIKMWCGVGGCGENFKSKGVFEFFMKVNMLLEFNFILKSGTSWSEAIKWEHWRKRNSLVHPKLSGHERWQINFCTAFTPFTACSTIRKVSTYQYTREFLDEKVPQSITSTQKMFLQSHISRNAMCSSLVGGWSVPLFILKNWP